MAPAGLLPLLARLLEYPDAAYPGWLAMCRGQGCPGGADAADSLRAFADRVAGEPIEALQELFTRTFDFDPKCTLDVGWHLYGENYERGDFLARMREELARHGVEEGRELPDHLPRLLEVMSRATSDLASELSGRFVLPAVERIRGGLDPESPFVLVMAVVHDAASAMTSVPAGGPARG